MKKQKTYWMVKGLVSEEGRLIWKAMETFKTMDAAENWIRERVAQGGYYGDYKVSVIEMAW